MIYRNIEKLVMDTPNNMELGEKLRELYWKEKEENDRDLDIWYVDNAAIANELELQQDVDTLLVDEDNNVIGTFEWTKKIWPEQLIAKDLQGKKIDGLINNLEMELEECCEITLNKESCYSLIDKLKKELGDE